ncbi:hypothetical protein SO802_021958 [Lithocarpus litseifolius]|uniref:Uncharacterized protein n=1 Tax=Lithocarpus litseifolius TaxID=425828 RepID=A0AAW2CGJ7_9ROSI
MEESIRGCYAESVDLTSDRFVKMILVDASFVLEFFFRNSRQKNPLVGEPWAAAVMLDLVLLENQLPFFVIQKLYKLAFPSLSDYDGLLELSFRYFREFNIQSIKPHPNVQIEHFTDLLRTFQIPPPEKLATKERLWND